MLLLLTVQQATARGWPVPRAGAAVTRCTHLAVRWCWPSQADVCVHLTPRRLSTPPLVTPMAPHHPALLGVPSQPADGLQVTAETT